MPASVSILTPVVTAAPGSEGIGQVTIRNTGSQVDQFAVNLVGDASAWARPDPGVLSLFPGAEQTITVRFSPPRSSAVSAGTIPFGVRVTSENEPDFSVVEEGAVQIAGFSSLDAKIVPRTSEGKRKAVHRIEVTNTGNAPLQARLSAEDADVLLAFEVEPPTLDIAPGSTSTARLKVAARKPHKGKGARRIPFQVDVNGGSAPTRLDASFEQKPKASILLFLAILVVAGVLVFLLKDQAGALTF